MVEIGSGSGTSYPGAIDTDSSLEVNSPNINKTRAKAELINDLAAAVIAVQKELGTDPAGNLSDLKTRLAVLLAANGALNSSTKASLPSASTDGRLYRVSDNVRGLWMDQGSQWFSLSGAVVNVQEFGAKPDGGVTDNATPFTNAFAAAGEGGKVIIPAGDNFYGFATGVTITQRNLTLEGVGDRSMLVIMNTAGQNLITVSGAQGVRLKNFSMAGHASSGHGISTVGASHRGYLENVFCRNMGGDCFNNAGGLGWTFIKPTFSSNVYSSGVIGPFPYAGASAVAKYGIRATVGASSGTNTIIGPLIEGMGQWGVRLNGENDTIVGGTIEGNGVGNIWLEGNSQTVYGTNAEVGGDGDSGCVKIGGSRNLVSGMFTGGGTPNSAKLEFVGATWATVHTSSFNEINIDAASKFTELRNVSYGSNGGGFVDNGSGTVISNLHNSSNSNKRISDKRNNSPINYARNGGFERWYNVGAAEPLDHASVGGYTRTGGCTLTRTGDGESDTTKYAGHYALKITANGAGNGIVYQGPHPRFIASEAKGFVASVWAKTVSGSFIFNMTAFYDSTTPFTQQFTATTTWTKFSAAFPFDPLRTDYDLRITFPDANAVVYFDNLFIGDGFAEQLGDWDNVKITEPEPVGHTNLVFSATPTIYGDVSTFQTMTLTGNITGITLANGIVGLPIYLKFTQDATGGRTVAWTTAVKWAGGSAPTITATASKSDVIGLMWDGTSWWDVGIRQNE